MTEQFDFIIVGAGAAGALIAHRLVVEGGFSVCLLEAGPKDRNLFLHIPGGFTKTFKNPNVTYQQFTEPSEGSGGRAINLVQGKTLGGSTAVNGFNYNRGQKEDFDGWAQMGNKGWGYEDILPLFKKTEAKRGVADPSTRGKNGPLPITDTDWRHPLCDAFIETCGQFGMPPHHDYNSGDQRGAGYFQRWIENGWRVSSARAFLHPLKQNPKLNIRTDAVVENILIDEGRAYGVRYRKMNTGSVQEIRASGEVIVCAGAAQSPKLLKLSGLGPGEELKNWGIDVIQDLPAVGENLQDHYMVRMVRHVPNMRTINSLGRGWRLGKEISKWLLGKPSILAISPSVAFGFTNARQLDDLPDIQLNFTPGSYKASVPGLLDSFDGATLGFYQLRPESKGWVRLKSRDPRDNPLVQPNYLESEVDKLLTVAGIRLMDEIFSTDPLGKHCQQPMYPDPANASDDELLAFAQTEGGTAYHIMGSCRMGPITEANAVVTPDLKVRGILGLRIADASVMPTMPSANLTAGVFMIAEKASAMIINEYRNNS
ncbi:MAG: GMC family oxidoreductase [Alphaproteobacteria bacterium]|nr:GMC family oxidoreductase [Alphaproteobacteria bacterium]